jgi:dienelactone hydrolase
MGVGVASELWLNHPLATGAVFLHALPTIPQSAYSGFPFQVHVGEDDIAFADLAAIEELHRVSRTKHLVAEVFRYPNASHFFTDSGLPDYDSLATSLTWKRTLDYLARLNSGDRD